MKLNYCSKGSLLPTSHILLYIQCLQCDSFAMKTFGIGKTAVPDTTSLFCSTGPNVNHVLPSIVSTIDKKVSRKSVSDFLNYMAALTKETKGSNGSDSEEIPRFN